MGKSHKKQRRGRKTKAARADKYVLYQESVQDPEGDVTRLRQMYKTRVGHPPRVLREDFCGTAALACAWVAAHRENRAIGVDLDPEPLAWCRRHNAAKLDAGQRARLELLEGDVLTVRTERADVVAAFNFSYFGFQSRELLRSYFERVRSFLTPGGIFVLDAYGGPESQERREERRRCQGFTYVWDQDRFDPITHQTRCYIHFEFSDRSALRRAFRYDWRLWMLPELQDLLLDAGFVDPQIYWEGTEKGTEEGNGIFRPRVHAEDDPAWVAYLVASRG